MPRCEMLNKMHREIVQWKWLYKIFKAKWNKEFFTFYAFPNILHQSTKSGWSAQIVDLLLSICENDCQEGITKKFHSRSALSKSDTMLKSLSQKKAYFCSPLTLDSVGVWLISWSARGSLKFVKKNRCCLGGILLTWNYTHMCCRGSLSKHHSKNLLFTYWMVVGGDIFESPKAL